MSKNYKSVMDGIRLSDELKKSIIENTVKAANTKRKKNNIIYIRRAAGVAACLAVCLLSYNAVTNYDFANIEPTKTEAHTPVPTEENIIKEEQTVPIHSKEDTAPVESGENKVKENPTDMPNQSKSNTVTVPNSQNAVQEKPTAAPSDGKSNASTPSKTEIKNNDSKSQPSQSIENTIIIEGNITNSTASNKSDTDNYPTVSAKYVEQPMRENESLSGNTNNAEAYIVQAGNPIKDVSTKEQIEEELGYDIKTPEYIPEGYSQSDMSVIGTDLVQINYESDDDSICYRTAKGGDDISGDYNVYDNVENEVINDCNVVLKSNDDLYYNASWTDNENSYSVGSINGLDKNVISDIVKSVD